MRASIRLSFVTSVLVLAAFAHGCDGCSDPAGGGAGGGSGSGGGAGGGGGGGFDFDFDGGDLSELGGDSEVGSIDFDFGNALGCGQIRATVRDFRAGDDPDHPEEMLEEPDPHPDFQDENPGQEDGLVEDTLGGDGNPVYAHGTDQVRNISNATTFAQWYEDVPSVNQSFPFVITLDDGVFEDDSFFPIDNAGWGSHGYDGNDDLRNFHFTTEVHTTFVYEESANQTFTFEGDDDLWLFIDGKLVIDLGGVHGVLTETVELNTHPALTGLVDGETYTMDIFHAERHTSASNFRIQTTIACFNPDPG